MENDPIDVQAERHRRDENVRKALIIVTFLIVLFLVALMVLVMATPEQSA